VDVAGPIVPTRPTIGDVQAGAVLDNDGLTDPTFLASLILNWLIEQLVI